MSVTLHHQTATTQYHQRLYKVDNKDGWLFVKEAYSSVSLQAQLGPLNVVPKENFPGLLEWKYSHKADALSVSNQHCCHTENDVKKIASNLLTF